MSRFSDRLAAAARAREAAGLTRRLVARSGAGEDLLDLAGNDYLGLAGDPRVIEGAVRAAQTWGGGARASRLVTGTLALHAELEAELAAFTGHPSALAFSTGYHANLGAVTGLAGRGDLIVSDAHVHASMVDACRLSRARVAITGHHDLEAVEATLATRAEAHALVLVESVYSVLGDAAPVAELAEICARHEAVLVVDEAHALGTAGPGGRGLVAGAGLSGAEHVVVTGTLSKSLGSQGGFVLGSAAVREHLVNVARPFVYDTGLAPAAAGAALAALRVLRDEPERVDAVRHVAASLALAASTPEPAAAVLSVAMPSAAAAVAAAQVCAEAGLRVGCFRPPSVPDGISRLRLTARATLTDAELATATGTLTRALTTALAAR
ncbi:8-amino-7-oxononanoate synthase [Spongisporangium articulatum]|uniref:8-amino-7-oxononanoate synthase n=1 Tax=Spongisporangium articulatum TaxID=3362603 RepID=A0ABW8AMC6_9ACTN